MEQFELKEEHIKLLQNMRWGDGDYETGAPAADGKRPYGNSNVPPDVADILGVELPDDDDQKYGEIVREIMVFHHECHIALEIILQTKSFEVGVYENTGHSYEKVWKKVR